MEPDDLEAIADSIAGDFQRTVSGATFGPFAEPVAPTIDDVIRLGTRIHVRHNVAVSRQIRRARKLALYRNAILGAIRLRLVVEPLETFPPYTLGCDLGGSGTIVLFGRTIADHLAIVDTSRIP